MGSQSGIPPHHDEALIKNDGFVAARARSRVGGRKPKLSDKQQA